MTLAFRHAARTDVGTVRTNNEDSALASGHLAALADGMGGHAAGEIASAVVTHALAGLVEPGGAVLAEPARALEEAALAARTALRSMSKAAPEMEGMGTTLVALAIGPDGVTLAHVGDSRVYRLRAGTLEALTSDHTHVQRLVDAGRLSPAEAYTHPYRSVILRSLDDTSDDLPDVRPAPEIGAGDRILLCSDGLSDYLTDDVLAAVLATGDPAACADALVEAALEAGTRDNVTVVVLDVVASDGAEPSDGIAPPEEETEPPATIGAQLAEADLSVPAREALASVFPEVAAEPEPVRPDARDAVPIPGSRGSLWWLALVVAAFALTTAAVWFAG